MIFTRRRLQTSPIPSLPPSSCTAYSLHCCLYPRAVPSAGTHIRRTISTTHSSSRRIRDVLKMLNAKSIIVTHGFRRVLIVEVCGFGGRYLRGAQSCLGFCPFASLRPEIPSVLQVWTKQDAMRCRLRSPPFFPHTFIHSRPCPGIYTILCL